MKWGPCHPHLGPRAPSSHGHGLNGIALTAQLKRQTCWAFRPALGREEISFKKLFLKLQEVLNLGLGLLLGGEMLPPAGGGVSKCPGSLLGGPTPGVRVLHALQ